MKHRKSQIAAAVGAALFVGATAAQAQAPAQTLTVQLYGQVNRALMFVDDDVRSKWFHVDGQPSSTRFGIMGSSQIAPGLRAGARIETEMKSNPSNVVNFGATQPGSPSAGAVTTGMTGTSTITQVLFAERWLDASLEGAWGRINIGQGSGAADDASTIDLSGTAIANGVCICDWAGNVPFNAGGVSTGIAPNNVIDNLDFESRYDRAMYTTPVFGGLRAQAGWGQRTSEGEAVEASLWFSGKVAGDLQAAIGWSKVNLAPFDRETFGGSVSWLSAAGFNITAAYTQREIGGTTDRDAEHWYAKVGYKFGPHALSLGYYVGEDQALIGGVGVEATAYAVAYVWNPVRWAEIYAAYILYQAEAGGTEADDMTVGVLGTRIRF
jgi:predicted porin